MTTETKIILEKLGLIQSELEYIKEHMIDLDLVMTDDDFESLKEAEKDLKGGKTKRLV